MYRQGRAFGDRLLVVRARPNETATTRFGFVAGKAVGGAVVRNRVKRRLRALADAAAPRAGVDVVVGARQAAAAASFDQLRRSFEAQMRRADALASVREGPGKAPGLVDGGGS